MNVSCVYKLRQALRLDPTGTPVKVTKPTRCSATSPPIYQDALGVDTVGLGGARSFFGFRSTRTGKPWTTFDGTPVAWFLPGFNTMPEPNGDIFMYPEGDRSVPPSGRMPRAGSTSTRSVAKSRSTTIS